MPDNEEARLLYNQTNNLIEALDSKDNKKYDIAIQLCDIILKIESETNIVRDIANDLKKQCQKLKNEDKNNEEIKEDEKPMDVAINIKADYQQKAKEAEAVLVKSAGIFRYNTILIDALKSYNINELENAKVVYELSDELLNNLYQYIKEEQVAWVNDKINQEKTLNSNPLLKYQTLVNMTLSKCEVLNKYGY